MDPRDLRAASKYVNNLLASRGLLRGNEIPFHKPTDGDGTPAKIINIIHELLSRRDKEAEERESLALTLRTLRTTETKQTEIIDTLKSKNADLARQNALLESASRSFTHTLRTAEVATKTLRDETTRIKTLLSQVRTQCANDIRKRDVQIQKMKERLTDTRGRGTRAPIAQCTVIGGSSNLASSRGLAAGGSQEEASSLAVDTTDFLTKLSQDLADENDNLIALVRTTLSTLKAIQGLPDDDHFLPDGEHDGDLENPVVAPPASFEDLTVELDQVMFSLKEVLNQPNYVPLEDLAERDAEIERLAAKNATLEEEWKKAIDLVDEWNKTLSKNFAQATEGGEGVRKSPKKCGVGRTLVDIVTAEGVEEAVVAELSRKTPDKRERWRKGKERAMETAVGDAEVTEEVPEAPPVREKQMRLLRTKERDSIGKDTTQIEEVEEADEMQMDEKEEEQREGQEVEETIELVQEVLKETIKQTDETPARKDRKRKAKKDVADTTEGTKYTEPVSKPQVVKDRKKGATHVNFEVQGSAAPQKEIPIRKTPSQKDGKRRVTKVNFEIPEPQEEPMPEAEPRDWWRKALETNTGAASLQAEIVQLKTPEKEKRPPATKDDVEMTEEALDLFLSKAIQEDGPATEEARKPRERKRRGRKDGEAMGEDSIETTIRVKEIVPKEAPKGRERRRRARKGGDRTLEEDTAETTIHAEETTSMELPKIRERRRRVRKAEDETMAEDTMEASIQVKEILLEAQPERTPRKRSASRAKKPVEDSILDELAAEPVPVHYEEIANEIRIIEINDEDAAGVEPSRARRRSLRNRDRYPTPAPGLQEASPARSAPVSKRKRKSAAGSTPRKRPSSYTTRELDGLAGIV